MDVELGKGATVNVTDELVLRIGPVMQKNARTMPTLSPQGKILASVSRLAEKVSGFAGSM